jgi:hypothetical protein
MVERADRGGKRERELRTRSQTCMIRDGFRNLDTMSPIKRKQYLQTLKIATRSLAVWPADLQRRRPGDPNARAKFADSKTHAAETSSESAIEIEESQMQAGRRCDNDAVQPFAQRLTPDVWWETGFFIYAIRD